MKKIVLILLLAFMFCGCNTRKDIKTLSAKQFIEKFENGDTFLMYAGTGECDYCATYTKTLLLVVKEQKMDIYYFDYDEIRDNEAEVNRLINDYLYQLAWTPTTYFVVNGSTQRIVSEKLSYTEVTELLKQYEIID